MRTVYKRIHVVREDDGRIVVMGSTCFGEQYSERKLGDPIYATGDSRPLTDEERRLLDENTEGLIALYEDEAEAARAKLLAERAAAEAAEAADRARRNYTYQPKSPVQSSGIPLGQGRTVKCHFCGHPMETELMRAPARGYRCPACIANRVTTPLAVRNRMTNRHRR